jgi:chorismate mutase
MSTPIIRNESKFLERARTALSNAQSHLEISPALSSFGMNTEQLSVGSQIYNNAKEEWEVNKKEDSESTVAKNSYKAVYNDLEAIFKRHRDFVLIFFKKQPDILIKLGVKGRFPNSYNTFFDKVKLFYGSIQSDSAIQSELSKIKLTPEVATDCLSKLDTLFAERSNYVKEIGESQASTKSKNAALLELKDWMDDFDATAKVALYDKPQLLEVLGIFVRS